MDTKLKNRHKLAIFLIISVIVISGLIMGNLYASACFTTENSEEALNESVLTTQNFTDQFVAACYILYNTEEETWAGTKSQEAQQIEEILQTVEYGPAEEYNRFFSLLDYRVIDGEEQVVARTMAGDSSSYPDDENLSSYAVSMKITYDNLGNPTAVIDQGEFKNEQRVNLKKSLDSFEQTELAQELQERGINYLSEPKSRIYYLAMRQDSLDTYLEYEKETDGHVQSLPAWFFNYFLLLSLAVAAAAWLFPRFQTLHTGEEKLFTAPPFELPLLAIFLVYVNAADLTIGYGTRPYGTEFGWIAAFAVVYWCSGCFRHIYTLGPSEYFKSHTISRPAWRGAKAVWKKGKEKCIQWMDTVYQSFNNIDFNEKNNKTILKLVSVNFMILFLITCLWFVGIVALIIYSVFLFFVLRKYFNDLKEKYNVLLEATNQMAEGKLDVEIDEDLGIFNPFKSEIKKIQDGYQKAVEKEVKSQRMKTELITNVSHDLKTPLTAIITYVNLLKEEKDEEKCRDYIDVLDKKSLRLKALIEDLFEISKASSKNVTLHLVDVDIVNLFKQVRLEHQEKFEKAGLEFRCTYPDDKVICELDSQKTYRIFENLLVNVAKYALSNTRVYVKVEKKKEEATLQIMNVSATELDFQAEEITERFVRGDASRNTEGSGLGLAIAKSFTELQKGRFEIQTEGDLFKATATFPLKKKGEHSVENQEE